MSITSLNLPLEHTSPRGGSRPPPGRLCPFEVTLTHCVEPRFVAQLSCLAVDEDSVYQTANSKHLGGERRKEWICQRAFVALYITSHRGHPDAVQYLLEHGNSERQLSVSASWGLVRVGGPSGLTFWPLWQWHPGFKLCPPPLTVPVDHSPSV